MNFFARFNNLLILIILIVILVIAIRASGIFSSQTAISDQPGLLPVDCWFLPDPTLPENRCFRMQVREDHYNPGSNIISFPVVVFTSPASPPHRSPVLHLGAGGPGAPMYLDSLESIRYVLQTHDDISINQGRNLVLMDPRGSGLALPLLSCQHFVDNEPSRLSQNLSPRQEFESANRDYLQCIEEFRAQGIDFKNYNSEQIVLDVEMLRQHLQVNSWVLIGVSYASIYAQLLAAKYPDRIESMVLDSATFLEAEPHHSYVERSLAPLLALLNYCDHSSDCSQPLPDFEQRFWHLHRQLNRNPIPLVIQHPYENGELDFVLNGERMLGALFDAVYDARIFSSLPRIIEDLEQRRYYSLGPYIDGSVAYLLDRTFGDVSNNAHYCYDVRPYVDNDVIRENVENLESGEIKSRLLLWLDWDDYCDELGISAGNPEMILSKKIEAPVLFLQGDRDPITPVTKVLDRLSLFPRHRLLRFPLSHSILTSDACAESNTARFVDDTSSDISSPDCP